MDGFPRCRATLWVGAALLSTVALCEPRVTPAPSADLKLANVPALVQGRALHGDETNVRFQWPGVYFQTRFKGRSVYFRTGTGNVILRAFVDGAPIGVLVKPARGLYLIEGLAGGSHIVRLEAITESETGTVDFGGFALPPGSKPLRLKPHALQMEFIGDSHTVGYGNTSHSRDCTEDEVWATTDTSQAFGPKIAKHYGADYQINAISGRGIVRNYDGSDGDPLPVAYPLTLPDQDVRYHDSHWRPRIIVIALGTNDFSTPLNAREQWKSRDDLHADYEATYVRFVESLRAHNPGAFIILWATDLAEREIQIEANKVVEQMRAKGEARIAFVPIDALEMEGCHWHPSVADHDTIAEKLIRFIDERHLASAAP